MFSNAAMQAMSAAYGLLGGNFVSPRIGGYGLLGQPPAAPQGYGQTGNLMGQYLQNLYMRRYNPPALAQYPGMVGSQMGPGGMQYMAPQLQQMAPPGKTEMQRMQEQLAAMQSQMNSGSNLEFDSGW
ncbi:MAG: hypothetical protein M9936_28655 [Caldilinea sp.]|nr:hypothetical protein [Caldilinea sp.]